MLVTHHVQLVLGAAEYIVYMKDGRINAQGRIQQLRTEGLLSDIVKESESQIFDKGPSEVLLDAKVEDSAIQKRPRQLVKEEERAEGRVKSRIYRTYMKASSYWTWVVIFIVLVLSQFVPLGERLWLKQWGEVSKA